MHLRATNEITNKMAEHTQANTANVEVPLQVTRKDQLKKVAQSKRLIEWNGKNKEKLTQEAKAQPDEAQKSEFNLT